LDGPAPALLNPRLGKAAKKPPIGWAWKSVDNVTILYSWNLDTVLYSTAHAADDGVNDLSDCENVSRSLEGVFTAWAR
jgi:hypothetical protein